MKRILLIAALIVLYGCAAHVAKPVVILGNKTTQTQCDCPEAAAQRARADKWKAYAEKLETQLGMPHEGQPP